jgi:hypothetical protein
MLMQPIARPRGQVSAMWKKPVKVRVQKGRAGIPHEDRKIAVRKIDELNVAAAQ